MGSAVGYHTSLDHLILLQPGTLEVTSAGRVTLLCHAYRDLSTGRLVTLARPKKWVRLSYLHSWECMADLQAASVDFLCLSPQVAWSKPALTRWRVTDRMSDVSKATRKFESQHWRFHSGTLSARSFPTSREILIPWAPQACEAISDQLSPHVASSIRCDQMMTHQ